MAAHNKTIPMTEGTIWKRIVAFAIPLFLGNLFQQLYNMADSLIVGNFLGSNALAAVSSSGNLIFLLVGFFNGIAVGAGVVIARYFGAQEKEQLQRSIHTTIAFGLICGIALSLIGVILAPKILILMGTPGKYFRIQRFISRYILPVPSFLSCTIFLSEFFRQWGIPGIRSTI